MTDGQKLKIYEEYIDYIIDQDDQMYGMIEDQAVHFRCRRVISLAREAKEIVDD